MYLPDACSPVGRWDASLVLHDFQASSCASWKEFFKNYFKWRWQDDKR
jgi:hypothetical protein